jgi:hypothetical protein
MNESMKIKYIGAVSLLGRLCRNLDEEDVDLVKMAMDDLLEEMPGRFEIWKVSGGFSLEPKQEVTK